jgi:hypothetical protein
MNQASGIAAFGTPINSIYTITATGDTPLSVRDDFVVLDGLQIYLRR